MIALSFNRLLTKSLFDSSKLFNIFLNINGPSKYKTFFENFMPFSSYILIIYLSCENSRPNLIFQQKDILHLWIRNYSKCLEDLNMSVYYNFAFNTVIFAWTVAWSNLLINYRWWTVSLILIMMKKLLLNINHWRDKVVGVMRLLYYNLIAYGIHKLILNNNLIITFNESCIMNIIQIVNNFISIIGTAI